MKIKFLIIRFSSIGDIVLTTPVVRCLKQQVENSEIHYVTKMQFASILNSNPYIDKLHYLDRSLKTLIKELKEEEFDYIIDLHHNLRSFIIKSNLKAIKFSFNKINFQKWLMTRFKINKLPHKHIVDRYLETCSLFEIVNDNKGLDFIIVQNNEVDLNSFPEAFRKGYIAFAIGARHATKQMPDDILVKLCNDIKLPIVLLGGKEDFEKAERIIKSSNKKEIINACGKFNLQQSASIIKQSAIVVTHDTGLMHIAAALNKKIISIWGNTIPEFGMYPYLPGRNSRFSRLKT